MAVDTRDKRMSMIGLDEEYVCLMKNPPTGGGIDATSRAMLLNLYSGIPLVPPPVFNPFWALKSNQIFGVTAPPTPEE